MASSTTPFALGAFLGNPNGSDPSAEATFEADYRDFSATMGANPGYIDAYVDQNKAIGDWVSNAGWQAWSNAQSPIAKGMIPVVGLPMNSNAPGSPSADQQFQAFAAGKYDSVIAGIVNAWAGQGFSNVVFRLGWEMNLSGTPGYVGDDAQSQADWVKAFQHIYTVVHQTAAAAGINVQVMWNPGTTGYSNAEATTNLYPGDQYVDVIGADIYSDAYPYTDSNSGGKTTYHDWATGGEDTSIAQFLANPVNLEHYWSNPAANVWNNDSSGGHSQSLDSLIQFAKAHGKSFAIPETGAGNSAAGTDVTDDAAFPKWLAQQLTAAQASGVKIDFVNIWDSNAGGSYAFSTANGIKPLESAAWAKYFGAQTQTATSTGAAAATQGAADVAVHAVAAPTAPKISGLSAATDTGISSSDNITNVNKPTVVGTAAAGTTVTLSNASGNVLGSAVTDSSGNWSIALGTSLAEGPNTLSATATNASGGTPSVPAVYNVVLDDIAAKVTAVSSSVVSGTNLTTGLTDVITLAMSEAVTVKGAPTLLLNGGTATYDQAKSTATSLAFDFTPTDAQFVSNLTVVNVSLANAQVTDSAGNLLVSTALSSLAGSTTGVAVNMAAPKILGLTAATDTGSSTSDGITNISKPTVVGTAAAGTTVTLQSGNGPVLGTAVTNSSGNWSITLGTSLTKGTNVLTAVATSASGAASAASAGYTVSLDNVGPQVTAVSSSVAAGGNLTTGHIDIITLAMSEAVTVTGSPTLILNGGTATYDRANSTATNLAFDFTPTVTQSVSNLAATIVNLANSQIVDVAGNLLTATSLSTLGGSNTGVAVNTPQIKGLSAATDTGSSASDGITNVSKPVVIGTAAMGATVTLRNANGTVVGTGVTGMSGTWSIPLGTALTTGANVLSATAVSTSKTVSATSASFTVVLDNAAAQVTAVSSSVIAGGKLATGQTEVISLAMSEAVTVTGTPTLTLNSGTAIYDQAKSTATSLAFDYTPTNAQSTPDLTVKSLNLDTSKLTDIAGNNSVSASLSSVKGADTGVSVNNSVATTIGSGNDSFVLDVSEDYYLADAQFVITVDGKQIGGTQTTTASHVAGQTQQFTVNGDWGTGTHTLGVNFLNDASGALAGQDRNLYVNNASYDGTAVTPKTLQLFGGGLQSMTVTTAAPVTQATDTIDLHVSEDAWAGDAQFMVSVNGKTIGTYTATASHAAGATQDVSISGNWGVGPNTIGITFINDAYGSSSAQDRNLYVDQIQYDGQTIPGAPASFYGNGTTNFVTPATTALTVNLSEDAWSGDAHYSIAIDGKTVVTDGTVTALKSQGQSQAVNLQSLLSAGTHDVAVSFLNDAHGASSTDDRNLYVTGIKVNGVSSTGATANLYGNDTSHFQITVPQA